MQKKTVTQPSDKEIILGANDDLAAITGRKEMRVKTARRCISDTYITIYLHNLKKRGGHRYSHGKKCVFRAG